ncbi:MAG: gamma-glutamyltransferase family protein [Solirubrobacteraceae bacterium]
MAEPNNAGIFGYGHLSAYLTAEGRFLTVDHGPRAPAASRADMYALPADRRAEEDGWPSVVDDLNAVGPLAPGVPGAVAGLWAAHRRAGRLPWQRLLAPAIALADTGLEVTWSLLLEIVARLDQIRSNTALAATLMPAGRLPRARTPDLAGERLDQRDLAGVLRRIAVEGPDALYHGSIAEAVARELGNRGGILTAADLATYAPKVQNEAPGDYRGVQYVTAADPVGYETLSLLATFALSDYAPDGAEHCHLLAEAMGHAFVDGASYASDPDFSDNPVDRLGSADFAARRAGSIALDRAAPRPIVPDAPWVSPGSAPVRPSVGGLHGTTQVVTADADGNMVSLITTIGADFGAVVAVPDTGIVLNNAMVNYDPRPGRGNSIAPGKMPFFAVPAIVATRDGRAAFAAAGSGGYPILSGVVSTMVGVIDHRLGVQAAIDCPRVFSQGNHTFVDARISSTARDRLERMGHTLVVQEVTPGELPFSRVGAIVADAGRLHVGAGPAWNTAVGAL